jgi:hypothetical protein
MGASIFESAKRRPGVKNMNRSQARLSRAAQVFDRIFNQYGAPWVYPLMGKDVPH